MNTHLTGIRSDVREFLRGTGKREEAIRSYLEESAKRHSYLYIEKLRDDLEPRMEKTEHRLSALEEAEYQRKLERKD
jgi:hypothetical protein